MRSVRHTAISWTLLVLVLAEITATAALAGAAGLGWRALANSYVISDAGIGLTLAIAGWPIAWRRPANPIGWLLLTGGLCYATSACGYAALGLAAPGRWPVVAAIASYAWPWAIAFFLPAVLLLFPDGRPPSPRWRWTVYAAVAFGAVFTLSFAEPPGKLPAVAGNAAYPTIPGLDRLAGVFGAAAGVLSAVVFGSALAGLIVRYRRGTEQVRRQLLWPVLALLVVLAGMSGLILPGLGALGIVGIALIPLSITVAILRYQLLDIRLVVSRSVLYLALTGLIVLGYIGLVAVLDAGAHQIGLGSSVIAALVVAVAFNPLRIWLQRLVNRAFYGARQDPVRAVAEVGAQLGQIGETAGAGLAGVLAALCDVMRWPSASIMADGRELARHGTAPALRHAVSLTQAGTGISELVVGLRPGESQMGSGDQRILALLAAPLAVAVHATMLSDELTAARGRLIAAREEERRRLRRDLHDGLGPTLTGVVLKADAARMLARSDADGTVALLTDLRAATTSAINDIRRLVYDLRPPALDGLGLAGSLREHARCITQRVDGSSLEVTMEVPHALTDLPAAVEVAAYRIATEALTNIARHSTASVALVTIKRDHRGLRLRISDNGRGTGEWQPGVGLTSIRERALELGGTYRAGPDRHGGRVAVDIPLDPSEINQ